MVDNNVQNIKFLRNGVVFGPSNDKTARQVALDAMNGQLNSLADGTAILGRYQETSGIVKTLVGFAYISGETKTLTVFDVDGASANVDEKIKTAIQALDAEKTSEGGKNVQVKVTEVDGKITAVNITTDNTVNSGDVANAIKTEIDKLDYTGVTTGDGVYVTNVTEADGVIAATTATLPSLPEVKENGKPIVAVSEDKGKVAASAGNINAEYVDVLYSAIKATNVKGALAEIADEIDGMDLDVVSGDGEVITAVSEKDGKVSASKTAIKDVKLTGYAKNTTATGPISETDDIEDALSKLENTIGSNAITNTDGSITVTPANGSTTDVKVHIKSGEKVIKLDGNGGGIYTNLNLVKITDHTLPAETKVRYELRDSDNVKIGESIDIPKDSHIVSITYNENTQKLVYTYIDVEGVTQTTDIDLSHLVLESEFASGVTSSNGVAHGVVDSTSEKDSSNNSFLTVGANGFKVDGIKGEIATKINALDATVGSTNVESGKHVAVQVVEDAGKLTALTVTETDIASAQGLADEITARGNADTELSNRLGDGVTTKNTASAQLSALSGTSDDASDVTSVYGAKKYAQEYADGKVAAVVANLDAEIEARKAVDGVNGNAYTADTSAHYINGASSLYGADQALDTALKTLDDNAIKSVKVNDKTLAKASNAVNVQISSTQASGTSESPIIVHTDDNGAVTLQISQIDCGTY